MKPALAALAAIAALLLGPSAALGAPSPTEVAAMEALLAERVQALLAAGLRASTVDCASVFVCAGAAAEARVVCDRPIAGGVACAGGSALGGAGASPLLLPGSLTWRATSRCGGECSNLQAVADACAWQGRSDAGCGVGTARSHPAVAKWNPLGSVCITYTVSAESLSDAQATLPAGQGILPSSKSALVRHSAAQSMCN